MTENEIGTIAVCSLLGFALLCFTVYACWSEYVHAKFGPSVGSRRAPKHQEVVPATSVPALWTTTVTTTEKPRKRPKKEATK